MKCGWFYKFPLNIASSWMKVGGVLHQFTRIHLISLRSGLVIRMQCLHSIFMDASYLDDNKSTCIRLKTSRHENANDDQVRLHTIEANLFSFSAFVYIYCFNSGIQWHSHDQMAVRLTVHFTALIRIRNSATPLFEHEHSYSALFCRSCANRLVTSSDVSMNRSTQFTRQLSVLLSNLPLGWSTHFSQQISLNSWICAVRRWSKGAWMNMKQCKCVLNMRSCGQKPKNVPVLELGPFVSRPSEILAILHRRPIHPIHNQPFFVMCFLVFLPIPMRYDELCCLLALNP